MERLVVFNAIGGLSPSISFVTTAYKRLESSTSHINVFRKFEERARETSEEFWKI
jgi:hypothetical protein